MPNMSIQIPHQLGREEAKRRVQQHLGLLHGEEIGGIDFGEIWDGDIMTFSVRKLGESIICHLRIEDDVAHLDIELPWFLTTLATTVKQELEQQIRNILDAAAPDTGDKKNGPSAP
jgi:hypothetical protein